MFIDTHCHLDFGHYDADRDDVVARAVAADVTLIVNPGASVETSRRAIALSERYPEVYAAVGVHPNECGDLTGENVAELRQLAAHPKVVAIGEIGLDYYWDRVEAAQQRRVFELQLALADELGLPVIIHNREAHADIAAVLRAWVAGKELRATSEADYLGVLHAYSGDQELAEEAYEWGFVLSLGGPITFKNARHLHALVPNLHLDRLMLETDGPFLAPHPHRGQRNEPAYVSLIAAALANLYQVSVDEVASVTTAVARRFLRITEPV